MQNVGEREAQFKRRLESFSDIVFGLSLSELALQLGIPATPHELVADRLRYAIFFGSFAIVCSLWVAHHRMFRTFTPTRVSVFLNFAYLAFTVLMPFGMQALLKFHASPIAFGVYATCYAGTAATMSALLVIGLRGTAIQVSSAERLDIFRHLVRYVLICAVMLASLTALRLRGETEAAYTLFSLLLALVVARRFIRRVPAMFMPAAAPSSERGEPTAR